MAQKWKNRPPGSNWGEFGPDDQLGRLNYLTEENALSAGEFGERINVYLLVKSRQEMFAER